MKLLVGGGNPTSRIGEAREGPGWREQLALGRANARPAGSTANSQAHPGRAVFVHARQLTGLNLSSGFENKNIFWEVEGVL